MSDIDNVISKVKQITVGMPIKELMTYGALSFEDFRQMMDNIGQGRLTAQEIITLARYHLITSNLFVT